MDEVDYKLNTNNSVLVVSGMEKLISNIKWKFKRAARQKFVLDNEELLYLREKCASEESLVSQTACQGLLALVECGILEIGHTMSTLITMLSIAYNHSAIISAMSGLLMLDLKSHLRHGETYKCQFKLKTPQHPFITIMEKNPGAIPDVLQQMYALCTHPDCKISCNSIELLRSVLIWLSCVPREIPTGAVWPLLVSLAGHQQQRVVLLQCLSWQQIRRPEFLDRSIEAYSTVMDSGIYQKDSGLVMGLLPVLAIISNELVKNGRDPRGCYILIGRGFDIEAPELLAAAGTTLMLLAENVTKTCAMYLQELFNLCLKILKRYEAPSLVVKILISYSLQWLNQPSCLTDNALKIAVKIIEHHKKATYKDQKQIIPNLLANDTFKALRYSDAKLLLITKILRTWERIHDNPIKIKSWLDTIKTVDNNLQLKFVGVLLGIVMGDDEELVVRSLKIILDLVRVRKDLSIQVLPVLLYKVANDTSPIVKAEAMRAIPFMAIVKENVPSIVGILGKLKTNKAVPTSFLIHLYTVLAEMQVRCYPYLREILLDNTLVREEDVKWEIELAKAVAVKRMCEQRASSHGRELVSMISNTLNRCTDVHGGLPTSTALDALGILWTEMVVGPPSTWKALEPKIGHDIRPIVQVALCNLLARVPELRVATPEYDQLISDAARKLWKNVAESDVPEIVAASCNALSKYNLSDYKLADLPEAFKKVVKLPAGFAKTPSDVVVKPEDVLDYIPCEIWPEVFKEAHQTAIGAVRDFVTEMIEREIKGYRTGVLYPENKTELPNLSHLPAYSVLRGMVDYIKKQALRPSYECPTSVLSYMLQCVSADYGRVLPSMDLSYLHLLAAGGQHLSEHCAVLAARQAENTHSAKVYIQEILSPLTEDDLEESTVLHLSTILPIVCVTMDSALLRVPLDKGLSYAYSRDDPTGDPEESMFVMLLESIRSALSKDIQEENRIMLMEFVEHYYYCVSDSHVSWSYIVQGMCALPDSVLSNIISPSSWWELSAARVRKSAAVGVAMGTMEGRGGMYRFNEVIDATAECTEEHDNVRAMIRSGLRTSKLNNQHRDWYKQLLARTQAAIAEREHDAEKQFLLSVVIEAAVMMTGYFVLEPDADVVYEELLPLALYDMYVERDSDWSKCLPQIVEWLLHTSSAPGSVDCVCMSMCVLCLREHVTHAHTWARAITQTLLL